MSCTRQEVIDLLARFPDGLTSKQVAHHFRCASYAAKGILTKLGAYGTVEKIKLPLRDMANNKFLWRLRVKAPSIAASAPKDADILTATGGGVMHVVDFMGGTPIAAAAKELCEAAAQHGGAKGSFNDIELIADAFTAPETLVAFYDAESAARQEAYRKSPDGIAAAKAAEERRSALQATHDALMKKLPTLFLKSDLEILDWLCAMQEPSDHVGVIVRNDTIVSAFERKGYKAGVNCGVDFRPEDRINVYRWLVGQALSGLKDGPAIHSIIHKFASEWKSKFYGAAA